MNDTFYDIPGYPGYQANRLGQIKGHRGRILHPHVHRNIARVGVYFSETQRFTIAEVRRLIWITFVGPIDPGMEITNLNNNPLDNRIDNLSIRHLHSNAGVLSDADVAPIFIRYIEGETKTAIAKSLGVSSRIIARVLQRCTYTHVNIPQHLIDAAQQAEPRHYSKLTARDVENIRLLIKSGVKQNQIARQYGVHEAMISRIKHRKSRS